MIEPGDFDLDDSLAAGIVFVELLPEPEGADELSREAAYYHP